MEQKVVAATSTVPKKPKASRNTEGPVSMEVTNLEKHHFIAESRRTSIDFYGWQYKHSTDPSTKVSALREFYSHSYEQLHRVLGENCKIICLLA